MSESLSGVGIYTVSEASSLTGVSSRAIRRWLWGYRGKSAQHQPLWTPQIPIVDDVKALGFRDLIEIKFVDHFNKRGHLSLQFIRKIIDHAAELLEQTYPLSSIKFKGIGKQVIAEVAEGTPEKKLLFNIYTGQFLLPFMIDYLYDALEYSEYDELARWYPLGKDRRVVVDPKRSFGRPISPEGVPTGVLAAALKAEKTVDNVVYWFKVDPKSVTDANEYENMLLAA